MGERKNPELEFRKTQFRAGERHRFTSQKDKGSNVSLKGVHTSPRH